MIGSTLYMACTDPADGKVIGGVCSCMMCKKMVINAGIEKVIIRENANEYSVYEISGWGRRRRQPFRKIRILIQRTFKNG